MNFDETFSRLLTAVEQDMTEPFVVQRDTMVAGRWVAMEASFGLTSERKLFGLMPMGSTSHCAETCLFLPAPQLDAAALEALLCYIKQAHDAVVQPDASHEFSMVSLVVVTQGFDGALQKQLKKFEYDKRYTRPQNGWSTTRIAVVDLADGKVHCNRTGSPVRDRLLPSLKKL